MRSANHSAPLQGLRLYKALLGLIQASGLAGGFDLLWYTELRQIKLRPHIISIADLSVFLYNKNEITPHGRKLFVERRRSI